MKTLPDLLEELDRQRPKLNDTKMQSRILNWFGENAGLHRKHDETDEQFARRIKEKLAESAMKRALEEE